jgi:hypothetical protein
MSPRDRTEKPASNGWTPEVLGLLEDWRNRANASQRCYYLMAERLRHRNYQLGIPVVVVSTVIGTTVFATLQRTPNTTVRLIVGSIAVLAAALAGLQTFLRSSELAVQHGATADWYASIRRDIEQQLATPVGLRRDAREVLDAIRKEMNRAATKAPELNETLWVPIARQYGVKDPPLPLRHHFIPAVSGGLRRAHAGLDRS